MMWTTELSEREPIILPNGGVRFYFNSVWMSELNHVIMRQNSDGSWNLEVYSDKMDLSTKSRKLLQDIRQEKKLNDTIFTTAVCLAWLRSFYPDRKGDWAIVSRKGEQFLQKQNVDATDLIDKFVSAFNVK